MGSDLSRVKGMKIQWVLIYISALLLGLAYYAYQTYIASFLIMILSVAFKEPLAMVAIVYFFHFIFGYSAGIVIASRAESHKIVHAALVLIFYSAPQLLAENILSIVFIQQWGMTNYVMAISVLLGAIRTHFLMKYNPIKKNKTYSGPNIVTSEKKVLKRKKYLKNPLLIVFVLIALSVILGFFTSTILPKLTSSRPVSLQPVIYEAKIAEEVKVEKTQKTKYSGSDSVAQNKVERVPVIKDKKVLNLLGSAIKGKILDETETEYIVEREDGSIQNLPKQN